MLPSPASGSDPEAWVRVGLHDGTAYYWHAIEQRRRLTLPAGVQPRYFAEMSEVETFVRAPTRLAASYEALHREIGLNADAGFIGMSWPVMLDGLAEDLYNGHCGHIVDFDEERIGVQLHSVLGSAILRVRPEKLRKLPVGAIVSIGQECDVSSVHGHDSGQYLVCVGGEVVVIHPADLRVHARILGSDFRHFRWLQESKATFIDRTGQVSNALFGSMFHKDSPRHRTTMTLSMEQQFGSGQ